MSVQNITAHFRQTPEVAAGDLNPAPKSTSENEINFLTNWNDQAENALQSLASLLPGGVSASGMHHKDLDLVVLLTDLATKMRKLESSIQQRRLNVECEDIRNRIAAKSELTRQIAEKAEIARQRQAAANITSKTSSVLSAILVIGAGILAATGVGSPVAALVICVVGSLSAADLMMSSFGDQGLGGTICSWLGGGEKAARIADIATKITLAVILLFTGIVSAAAMPAFANIGLAGLGLATAGSSGVNSLARFGAQTASAATTALKAQAKSAQAIIQFRNDEIDRAITLLRQSEERFSEILNSITATTRTYENFHARARQT